MKQIVVEAFGGPERLQLQDLPDPEPGAGQVVVALTSIGMNHADLMGRRGEYKAATGEPPFVPGLEGGGHIVAVGAGVLPQRIGERVMLAPGVTRPGGAGGSYRSHYVCSADQLFAAPSQLPDDQLGAVWLSHLTAYACLVWAQRLQPGQFVGIPAASSALGLAAAQVVRQQGGIAIGLTSSEAKVAALRSLPEAMFDHLVVTHAADPDDAARRTLRPWHREIRQITGGHGVDVFFDPVAAGPYLDAEIRALAQCGTVWVYGLLGATGPVNVQPLIIRRGAIRGWVNGILLDTEEAVWRGICDEVLAGFASGAFRQHVSRVFSLDAVQTAHREMEKGEHLGKWVLRP